MEEVQKARCSNILRGTSLASLVESSPNPEYGYQRNNKLVWDETILIIMDLFDNVWGDKSEIVVDHCVDITVTVRFLGLILYT